MRRCPGEGALTLAALNAIRNRIVGRLDRDFFDAGSQSFAV